MLILLGYIGGNPNVNPKIKYRANIFKNITHELEDAKFKGRSTNGRIGVFTRDRSLSFKNIVILIIMFKSSIQRELDDFFRALNCSDFKIREVTKGAFTQARAKLNSWAFKRLNEIAVNTFYSEAEYSLWHGKRLLAVDGTRLVLPNHPSIVKEFGQHKFGPKADSPRSLAMGSMLYDVLNLTTIDAEIAPYSASERDLLVMHLDKIKQGDLLLLDRGYPCFWLLFLLSAKRIDFCVRLKEEWWLKVKDFTYSTDRERLVTFTLPKKDRKKLEGYPEMQNATITCRLIKIELPSGEKEILCTSLIDNEKYNFDDFGQLYHYRWNEEEAYKMLKSRIELENFSGKTANAIKQDFFAKIFLMSLCATLAHPIEEKVIAEYKADEKRKHDQKINRTNALSMTRDILIGLFIRKQVSSAFDAFDRVVSRTREIIRPNRSFQRIHRPKKPYSMNYKPL